jgi:release factor glutamine methyltransferase
MSEDEIILTHILQCRFVDLTVHKPTLTSSQQEQFDSFKRRRAAGEPLQYLLGTCNFMGLELFVNPSVLVPRPETEQLTDTALKYLSLPQNRAKETLNILDLGTGSGNIAIALAHFISRCRVISVDISHQALELAEFNACRHKVESRIQFIQGDILSLKNTFSKAFDLVISNPPYIPTGRMKDLPKDVQKEPSIALDGGKDGLKFYRNIIKYTPCLLSAGACLMMEFGDGQAQAVTKLIEACQGFSRTEIIQDLAGRDRIIKAVYHSGE